MILPERISLPIRRIPAVFAIGGPHRSTDFRRDSAVAGSGGPSLLPDGLGAGVGLVVDRVAALLEARPRLRSSRFGHAGLDRPQHDQPSPVVRAALEARGSTI